MKFKTTKKEINAGYVAKIRVGYCDLQWLLYYQTPIAYTCGRDGWHADIYEIRNNIAIVTGYEPFGNYNASYELKKEYENKDRSIVCDYTLDYETQKEKVNDLLWEFVDMVLMA